MAVETITLNGFAGLNTRTDGTNLRAGLSRSLQDVFRCSVREKTGEISAIQERAGVEAVGTAAATKSYTLGSRVIDLTPFRLSPASSDTLLGSSYDAGRMDNDFTDWTVRTWTVA